MYPETKGVALEEMDAVFGEASDDIHLGGAREERAAFLPTYPPAAPLATHMRTTSRSEGSWLGGLFSRNGSRKDLPYEPLADEENGPPRYQDDVDARGGRYTIADAEEFEVLEREEDEEERMRR